MGGGEIQIVAKGIQDMYLIKNPQITFFKVVYRRYTNFAMEMIQQNFLQNLDFGNKASCILSRNGDLIGNIYLIMELPMIPLFLNSSGSVDCITQAAWTKNIGYYIIKTIELDIGGQTIDTQYGEWLYIWKELTETKKKGIEIMIGNVDLLTNYSFSKQSYMLYIPLQFWFCRASGLTLPIVSLQYSEIKISVELQSLSNCLKIAPTHFINIIEDIVNFKYGEYIEQNVNGTKAFGIFIYYDVINKLLYYVRISNNSFQSITNTTVQTITDITNLLLLKSSMVYYIYGITSKFKVMPNLNSTEMVYSYIQSQNITLNNSYLLVNYIYLDSEERIKFSKSSHEYLFQQVNYIPETVINSQNITYNIGINHPTTLLVWVSQLSYNQNPNVCDFFNYTDNYIFDKKYIGKNLINQTTIQLNGHELISFRDATYFNWIQPYQLFTCSPVEGINIYSFCLFPEQIQPSGSCNMSKIDNIQIRISFQPVVNFQSSARLRCYSLNYNILRIANGLCGIAFSN